MDASELWPILAVFVLALIVAGLAFYLSRRLMGTFRVLALAGMVLLCLLALLVDFASLWFDVSYTRHLPALLSPDGRHRALVSYTINTGTGVDQAEVAIRGSWSPRSHRVYAGPAHYDPETQTPEPELDWIDNTHLRIHFHMYVGTGQASREQGCAAEADGVQVVCEEDRVHAVKP